ncbi:hypothetical protein EMIT0P74_90283 [Pseudomonas sp. IT-P74]
MNWRGWVVNCSRWLATSACDIQRSLNRPSNREQARPVGASLLAMVVNDNACILNDRGAGKFFASELAPTGGLSSSRDLSLQHR